MLENNWGNVGWELQMASTMEAIRCALAALSDGINREIEPFTRVPSKPADARQLRLTRREISHNNSRIRAAYEFQRTCQEAADRAKNALRQLQAAHQDFVTRKQPEIEILRAALQVAGMVRECETRDATLASAQHEYNRHLQRDREVSQRLADEEAHFAQSELLRFILSLRYSLVPMNLANAMAGLPYIGCRQSFKRCGHWESSAGNTAAYKIFKIIRAGVRCCSTSTDAILEYVERFLREHTIKNDFAASELRANWYYVKKAVGSLREGTQSVDELPYRITAAYHRFASHPTAVDVLFQEEQQLK